MMRLSIPAPFESPLNRVHRFLPLEAMEALFITLSALGVSLVLFGLFVMFYGYNPIEAYSAMYLGSFGAWSSIRDSLSKAAPLLLTGLCVALPLRLGMVIIGGEGAMALGGLAAAAIGHAMINANPVVTLIIMCLGGMITGGVWILIAGSLKQYRGVNETISSLLLTYVAISLFRHMVEGPLNDPSNTMKKSTFPISTQLHEMVKTLGGMDMHWGITFGVLACIFTYVLLNHTVVGFAASVVGGNVRAAKVAGLSVARLVVMLCILAGAAAGMAGVMEVAAVHKTANDSILAGYGFQGILVAFLARGNPLAIIPVALLLGGISASGGVIQRRVFYVSGGKEVHMSAACVEVFKGIIFLTILASETFYGKYRFFQRKEA
jgi:simple sugar transport system permease protein